MIYQSFYLKINGYGGIHAIHTGEYHYWWAM